MGRLTLEQQIRLLKKVDKSGDCWIWTAGLSGTPRAPRFHVGGKALTPRRLVYELERQLELPASVKLFAWCRNSKCVNPDHMTWRLKGGRPEQDECKRGHDLTDPDNIYWTSQDKRACRKCIKIVTRARRLRYLEEGRGWGRSYQAHPSQ